MATKKIKASAKEVVSVTAPRMAVLHQRIVGTSPFVQARFSEKSRQEMRAKHEAGSTAKKGAKKEARNFGQDYEEALHRGPKGEYGFPAAALRSAAVSACRIVNFKMTLAKLGLFAEADFVDPRDGTGLIALEGEPKPLTLPVRNATGVADLRVRPIWPEWAATLRVRFDEDMFTVEDVLNLLTRIGIQVGLGEGRADSKKSAGMGWGFFRLDGVGRLERLRPPDVEGGVAA
jgi:hypothetical protein